jgi:hypothetical protein
VSRLSRQLGPACEELDLPDGTKLRYRLDEAVDAFSAVLDGEDHPLIQPFASSETTTGFPGLVRSLVLSQELVEECER